MRSLLFSTALVEPRMFEKLLYLDSDGHFAFSKLYIRDAELLYSYLDQFEAPKLAL